MSAPIVYWKAFLKLIHVSDFVLKEEVSFQIFLGRGFVRVGVAGSIVKATVVIECKGTHTCVFLCASCFLLLFLLL